MVGGDLLVRSVPVIHEVADEPGGPLAVADAALEGLLLEVHGVHVLPQLVRRPEAAAALHWPVKFQYPLLPICLTIPGGDFPENCKVIRGVGGCASGLKK